MNLNIQDFIELLKISKFKKDFLIYYVDKEIYTNVLHISNNIIFHFLRNFSKFINIVDTIFSHIIKYQLLSLLYGEVVIKLSTIFGWNFWYPYILSIFNYYRYNSK